MYEDEGNPVFGTASLRYKGEFCNLDHFPNSFYPRESKNMISNLFALDKYSADYQDGLKFVIDTSYWEYFGNKVYIGIYYTEGKEGENGQNVEYIDHEFEKNKSFDFKLSEIKTDELL